MAHELAGALQQTGRIRQRCVMKEPYVYVRTEHIALAEGRVPAFSHYRKPLMRDGPQSTCMLFYLRIDGGISLDSLR
jgi:hypothetical protein